MTFKIVPPAEPLVADLPDGKPYLFTDPCWLLPPGAVFADTITEDECHAKDDDRSDTV